MKLSFGEVSYRERGYVLLVLLLFITVLSIGMLAAVKRIEFQLKRDREEELIHRGVQYSRAVRRFIKEVGRYPVSIEELESTNNMRFLRKRYKDPITGKDFRILHIEDVAYLDRSQVVPGTAGAPLQQPQAGFVNNPAAVTGREVKSGPPEDAVVGDPADLTASDVPIPPVQKADTASTSEQAKDESQPTINESPVIGVASISKAKAIREFHNQNRYNQWLFIYNPATDRAGVLTTPDQPLLNGATQSNGQGAESKPRSGTAEAATTQDPRSQQNQQ